MIRHPSEHFIKFLMTQQRPEAQDDKYVLMMVTSLGYPAPASDYLIWLRTQMAPKIPAGFQPQNRYHRDSVKFLRAEGIYSLHNPDEPTREASTVVTHLRARQLIEQLLLGHMEPKEIAKKVNAKLSEYFTTPCIEAYAHYYWNVDLLRVEEWAQLLEGYDIQKSKTLAILQMGPAMALHSAGFQQQIESKMVLREMLESLYFDFREWKTKPLSASRTKALVDISKSAAHLDERLSQADSAIKESLVAFEKFRMKHAELTVPDVKSVATEGNYTGSGAKLLEAGVPTGSKGS